jgi:hypothetical protein
MTTININDVRRLAPAAFATTPVSSLTESYAHVTTAGVLDALQQDGWQITHAIQRRSRSAVAAEHGKHEISLTHPELPTHAEGAPLLRLSNSSDGSHAFRLIGGFLRFACTNQLYTGIKAVGGVFYHRGGSLEDRIVAGARDARASFDKVISVVDLWRQVELNFDQQIRLADIGVNARWGDNAPFVRHSSLLVQRRSSDVGDNLWTSFNRVQEAIIRGGFDARFPKPDAVEEVGNWRRVRKVTGIVANERINTALWQGAEALAAELTA